MKYTIEVAYQTGDSFGSEDRIKDIEFKWENLDAAKESLRRIENHYQWDKEFGNRWKKPKGKLPDGVVWIKEYNISTLEMVDDNMKPFQFCPFWIGYFEHLHLAEIKIVDDIDNDMVFRP